MLFYADDLNTASTESFGHQYRVTEYRFSVQPQYWQVQSGGQPLLINEAGRLVYGGAAMEYVLNAYTKTYGGAVLEYILGGIVNAEFNSILNLSAPFIGEREADALFTSAINFSSPFSGQVEVEASFDSIINITSLFPAERTMEAEFSSVIDFGSEFLPDDAEIDAWVFTLGADAPPISRYGNFDFNSFVQIGGRYYAASEEGIFELSGADDDGDAIASYVLTPRRAQGADKQSRVPILYLTGRSSGVLHCAVVDEDGAVHDYAAESALGDRDTRTRVKVGRGLKASFWQLKIGNERGEDFELTDAGTLPDVQKRRVR